MPHIQKLITPPEGQFLLDFFVKKIASEHARTPRQIRRGTRACSGSYATFLIARTEL
jgi:hypothetical protein